MQVGSEKLVARWRVERVALCIEGRQRVRQGRARGSEQSKPVLEPALRQELWDCTYKDVEGFYNKYFEGKDWTVKSDEIYDDFKSAHVNGCWADFPIPVSELKVWEWWSAVQSKYLTRTRGTCYTTKSKSELAGTDSERQLDLLVKHADAPSQGKHVLADKRIVGEHKPSQADPSAKSFQLARCARDVFATQPTRCFIHGFLLLGTSMELYVFDRSGAYGAKPFDINKEPERFVRVHRTARHPS